MTRHNARAFTGAGALLVAGALTLTACGGSGFEEPAGGTGDTGGATELTSSDDALSLLIGSSGDAETDAVDDAVAAWSDDSGVTADVQVASDLPQQLSQGFAAGSPPDLFYLAPEAIAGYADNGSLQPYGDLAREQGRLLPLARGELHVDDTFYCAPEGLLDARARHQHPAVGGRGPHRRRHPDHLGRAGRRRQDADDRRPGGPRPQQRVPAPRRRSWPRPAAAWWSTASPSPTARAAWRASSTCRRT